MRIVASLVAFWFIWTASAPARADPPAQAAVAAPAAGPSDSSTSIGQPVWLQKPTGEDFARLYPEHAQTNNIDGYAKLRCVVDGKGRLSPCSVLEQDPPGEGFDRAALELSKRFRMAAKDGNGLPTNGRSINIPIHFHVFVGR